MSDEKPTREQLAASAHHDPNTCTEGCRAEHHGDQAYSAEEVKIARLEAEVARLTAALVATEKLKNELVFASNGGPSRELAIVTLSEAIKANRELRAEVEQLKVERDSQASMANAYMRERNACREALEGVRGHLRRSAKAGREMHEAMFIGRGEPGAMRGVWFKHGFDTVALADELLAATEAARVVLP